MSNRPRRGPRTGAQIMAYVWQLHPQDAPDPKCLHVHISQMRRMLAGKYRILCGRGSQGPHPYRLERY